MLCDGYSEYQSLNHQKPQRSVAGLHTTCDPGAHHGEFGCGGAHDGGIAGGRFGSAFATPLPKAFDCTPATSPGNPRRPAPRPPAMPTAAASRFRVFVIVVFVVVCAIVLSFSLTAFIWLPNTHHRLNPLRICNWDTVGFDRRLAHPSHQHKPKVHKTAS